MASQRDITRKDGVFIDTDRLLRYTMQAGSAGTVPDVSSWALAWVLRAPSSGSAALFTKATGGGGITVSGVYNADPALNGQHIDVQLADTDTYDPTATPPVAVESGFYIYALKRTDAGQEDVLAYGTFELLSAAVLD